MSNCGAVFSQGLTGLIGASSLEELTSEAARARAKEACAASYEACKEVESVDVFISHNWGAKRWEKFLAMCFHLNFGLAIKVTVCSASTAITVLLLTADTVTGLGGSNLVLPLVLWLPMSLFFIFFFFGQTLTCGCCAPSFWLDKLCVLQTDDAMKAKAISGFPAVLARSRRMLILWDEEYFDRMWCNLELAVFTRFSMDGTKNIHFLPVWLAPWFLALLTSDLVGVTLLRAMAGVMAGPDFLKAAQDSVNEAVSQLPISLSPDLIRVIWETLEMTASFAPYYLCALPTVLVLQWKIRSHGLMLQQMRSFDARTAQCSLESDRALLQQEIAHIFGQDELRVNQNASPVSKMSDLEASDVAALKQPWIENCEREPMEMFNACVRGPLRDAVLDRIGSELHMSYSLALAAQLPMLLYGLVDTISCSGHDCQDLARSAGLSSGVEYMELGLLYDLLSSLVVFPAAQPLLFGFLSKLGAISDRPWLNVLLGLILSFFLYTYIFLCASLCPSLAIVATQQSSPEWWAALLLFGGVMLVQLHLAFR